MARKDRPKKAPKLRMRDIREAEERKLKESLYDEPERIVVKLGPRKPYTPKYHHPLVLDIGKDGGSETAMAVACGLSRGTFRSWQKTHPELGEVVRTALTLAEMYWEERWRQRMDRYGHNANAYKHLMGSRFRETYGEKIQVSGDEEAPLTVITRRIVRAPKRGDDE